MKDLISSGIYRQNISNNQFGIYEIQNQLIIDSIAYNNELIFTKDQIAEFFDVDY